MKNVRAFDESPVMEKKFLGWERRSVQGLDNTRSIANQLFLSDPAALKINWSTSLELLNREIRTWNKALKKRKVSVKVSFFHTSSPGGRRARLRPVCSTRGHYYRTESRHRPFDIPVHWLQKDNLFPYMRTDRFPYMGLKRVVPLLGGPFPYSPLQRLPPPPFPEHYR